MTSGILHEPYLEPEALSRLKLYKYSAVDKSFIYNHILKHWADFAVKLFPIWMAPNVITLSGFGFIVINAIILYYLNTVPSWAYLSFGIGLFLYQTFDNVDGRQARRTGTSSALGHIFDHTIDSLNCVLGGVIQTMTLCFLSPVKAVALILIACAAMWFSTWEEYHTGTLFLGYFNGPTEGILIACSTHLISAFFGPDVWLRELRQFPLIGWTGLNISLQHIVALLAFSSLLFIHIPGCVFNVYKSCRKNQLPFSPTLLQHTPFIVFCTATLAWTARLESNAMISNYNRSCPGVTPRRDLIELSLLLMFSFGMLSPRIILARLTRSPFPWFNFGAFIPITIGAMYIISARVIERPSRTVETMLLRTLILLSGFAFLRWASLVIERFTKTLEINCFTIKTSPDKRRSEARK